MNVMPPVPFAELVGVAQPADVPVQLGADRGDDFGGGPGAAVDFGLGIAARRECESGYCNHESDGQGLRGGCARNTPHVWFPPTRWSCD